jgi:adenylate kinase family enzyme
MPDADPTSTPNRTPDLGAAGERSLQLPRRVAVVGTTGSGKTTYAGELARRLDVPHIELDALYWEPEWTHAAHDVFRERIREATATGGWVTDGNYATATGAMLWEAADTLLWLDYSIALIYRRLFMRTTRRAIRGVELWNGNRESLRAGFMSRDSLFVWALRTHWKHRREWPAMLREPRFAHLTVHRFRSPRAAARYLDGFAATGTTSGGPPRATTDTLTG